MVLAATLLARPPATAGDLVLFDGGRPPTIVYTADSDAPVSRVAALLGHDLQALTGQDPRVTASVDGVSGPGVIIGRPDSPAIATLLRDNHIATNPIAGKWETYGRAVVPAPWNAHDRALVIFGSDTRGAIWGTIDLTRELGVSAWEWWADVVTRKTDRLAVDDATRYSHEPAVKYRGIFLNAGAHGLNPWASKTFDPETGNMGPKTYARIFELLWRPRPTRSGPR